MWNATWLAFRNSDSEILTETIRVSSSILVICHHVFGLFRLSSPWNILEPFQVAKVDGDHSTEGTLADLENFRKLASCRCSTMFKESPDSDCDQYWAIMIVMGFCKHAESIADFELLDLNGSSKCCRNIGSLPACNILQHLATSCNILQHLATWVFSLSLFLLHTFVHDACSDRRKLPFLFQELGPHGWCWLELHKLCLANGKGCWYPDPGMIAICRNMSQ